MKGRDKGGEGNMHAFLEKSGGAHETLNLKSEK